MRHKIQHYKKELRRIEIDSYFSQRRREMLQSNIFHQQQFCSQNTTSNLVHDSYLQTQEFQRLLLEANCVQDYPQITKLLSQFSPSFRGSLKQVKQGKPRIIRHIWTSICPLLFNIIKTASQSKVAHAIQQPLHIKTIDLLNVLLSEDCILEQDILHSELLPCLLACLEEPRHNEKYATKLITITHQLIFCSHSNILFRILLDRTQQIPHFNIDGPFKIVEEINPHPSSHLSNQFVAMLKQTFSKIIQNGDEKNNLITKYQKDMAFDYANRSFHCYACIDFTQENQVVNLHESLTLMRILIEQGYIKPNNLPKFNFEFKILVDLLNILNTPYEIKNEILTILDHLIYTENPLSASISVHLVKKLRLLPVIWGLRRNHNNYVVNIISNLALCEQCKDEIHEYVSPMFLLLKCESSKQSYFNFIYNWFFSQSFKIESSIDRLIVTTLSESEEDVKEVAGVESLLWLRLLEEDFEMVAPKIPARILNRVELSPVLLIRDLLGSNQACQE